MSDIPKKTITTERPATRINGFLGIFLFVVMILFAIASIIMGGVTYRALPIVLGVVICLVCWLPITGLTMVQPNVAAVITFFGKYKGVIRASGFHMAAPFSRASKVSLRVCNFNSEKLKVNDAGGNPIEIAAVIVYRVVEPAAAILDVDNYEQFVEIQSETSLRHVAAQYPYDDFDDPDSPCLRRNSDEISRRLQEELQERLAVAGVEVMEARLTHLAYATEIASAMLQRQQAAAILAARQIIVDGAVGMALMAIEKLETDSQCDLDEERKMNMINNVLVSIITDRSSQPVINVGSMY